MAVATTTTSILDNLLATYFVRTALDRLVPKAILYNFAQKTGLPKGEGKTVRWNAWSNFAPVTGALGTGTSEGVNSGEMAVSSRKKEATVAQYGRVVRVTELLEYTSSLDVVQGIVENLSDSAGLSVDKVVQIGIFKSAILQNAKNTILSAWMSCVASGFHAGSNSTDSTLAWGFPVVFATSAGQLSAAANSTTTVSCHLSMYSISKVVRQLRRFNAMELADGNFAGITCTDNLEDLTKDPDFKEWNKYTSAQLGQTGASGQGPSPVFKCGGVTWYASNNIPTYRASTSCDLSVIFGKGAFGCTGFNTNGQKGFEIIITRPGPQTTNDPLHLNAYLSYKFTMAAAALNVSAGRILITHSRA